MACLNNLETIQVVEVCNAEAVCFQLVLGSLREGVMLTTTSNIPKGIKTSLLRNHKSAFYEFELVGVNRMIHVNHGSES